MSDADSSLADFHKTGRLWLRGLLSDAELDLLQTATDAQLGPGARLTATKDMHLALAESSALSRRLSSIFGPAFPTRIVAFSKTAKTNWQVGWHRDRIIAVQSRVEIDGYDNWSCKSGSWHCRPPQDILDGMLFCRLFLDTTSASNGGMEFVIGSHRNQSDKPDGPIEVEDARRGDVLILHMNMLHRSRPSKGIAPRRVLRVNYATAALPAPLAWSCPDQIGADFVQ